MKQEYAPLQSQNEAPSAWAPMQDWVGPVTRATLVTYLDAAYRQVLDEKWHRLGMWHWTMAQVRKVVHGSWQRHGFELAPLYEMAFLDRIAPPAPINQVEHMRLVSAYMTDVTKTVQDHIRYRIQNEGNVHFEFIGRTGSGKSSCALTVADWMSPIRDDQVLDHINYDFGQIGRKLGRLQRGQTLVQDELLALAGDGARTTQMMIQNMLDTLRQSGVSLFLCAPETREMNTVQAGFEAIAWNTKDKRTLFLVHVDGKPVGVTSIPWVRFQLWQPYSAWKEENVRRSQQGEFKETAQLAGLANRQYENERLVKYLLTKKRPKPRDFQRALKMFNPEMMTEATREALGEFMAETASSFTTLEKDYQEVFGVKPSEGLKRVALKCYKE